MIYDVTGDREFSGIEKVTFTVEANSEEEAKNLVLQGKGEFVDSEFLDVIEYNNDSLEIFDVTKIDD